MSSTERLPIRARSGQVVAWALVDAEDYERVAQYRWSLNSTGYVVRATTLGGKGGRQIGFCLSREIMGIERGDARCVDHVNRDRLDNRRRNLRVVTAAENNQNVIARRGSTSRFRGVSRHPKSGKWEAKAQLNGVQHWLGSFDDEEEAAQVAADWRRENMPFTVEERPVLAA